MVVKHVLGGEREIEMYLEELENPFTILHSEYKQSKFLSGKFETVEPVECDGQNKGSGRSLPWRRRFKSHLWQCSFCKCLKSWIKLPPIYISKSIYCRNVEQLCHWWPKTQKDFNGSLFKSCPLFSTKRNKVPFPNVLWWLQGHKTSRFLLRNAHLPHRTSIYCSCPRSFPYRWSDEVTSDVPCCFLWWPCVLKMTKWFKLLIQLK